MPILRVEYIDTALEKTSEVSQLADLRERRELVSKLAALEDGAPERFLQNRLDAGEDPKKVRVPTFASRMSSEAGAEIHRLQLRKCRRATVPFEIVQALVQLNVNDLTSWSGMLKYTELPKNKAVTQEVITSKEELHQSMQSFVARWQNAP